jgi:hypothetical protein
MRNLLVIIIIILFFTSCKKEVYTSEPVISFISISPNSWTSNNTSLNGPLLTFSLKDAEGDFGFQDTSISYVYIRNVADSLSAPDSLAFPDLTINDKTNLNVEVSVDISNALPPPHITHPYTDTLYFEVYVKDFADHKSNVIRSTTPFYYITP